MSSRGWVVLLAALAGLLLAWSVGREVAPEATRPGAHPADAADLEAAGPRLGGREPFPGAAADAEDAPAVAGPATPEDPEAQPLHGTVVDDETGAPLPGAWVSFGELCPFPPSGGMPAPGAGRAAPGVGDVAAGLLPVDTAGRFGFRGHFALWLRGQPGLVHAWAPGHAWVSTPVLWPGTLTVRLPRARAPTGRVVDTAGAPVPGAEVRMVLKGGWDEYALGAPWPDAVLTDERGRFEVAWTAPMALLVVARTDRAWGVVRCGEDETDVGDLVLDRAHARLSIRLGTADGGVVPGAWLRWAAGASKELRSSEDLVLAGSRWPGGPAFRWEEPRWRVDADVTVPLSPADGDVRVAVPGYLPFPVSAFPAPGEVGVVTGTLDPDPAVPGLRIELLPDPPWTLPSLFATLISSNISLWEHRFVLPAGTRTFRLADTEIEGDLVEVLGPHWVGRGTAERMEEGGGFVARVPLERAATLEVELEGVPREGVSLAVLLPDIVHAIPAFEVAGPGEVPPSDDVDVVPSGLRYASSFFAAPDPGGSIARRTITGLPPGRYRLRVDGASTAERAVRAMLQPVVLEPGRTTRLRADLR